MKILLLGAGGQVGHELAPLLAGRGEIVAPLRAELDVGDLAALRDTLARSRPELVVNASAYNEVDRAESEPEVAMRVNGEAVGLLGEYARAEGAALIHYSTDFVFDGAKTTPYVETDAPNPLGAYGRSKLMGETLLGEMDAPALVLRTAWVYSVRRKSFVSAMLKLARERREMRAVTDQVGSPTWCRDLARATALLVDRLGPDVAAGAREHRGVYHAAGGGGASRFELARATINLDGRKHEHVVESLEPATTADFPAPARRPAYGVLDCSRLGTRLGVTLLPWKEALAEALRA